MAKPTPLEVLVCALCFTTVRLSVVVSFLLLVIYSGWVDTGIVVPVRQQ